MLIEFFESVFRESNGIDMVFEEVDLDNYSIPLPSGVSDVHLFYFNDVYRIEYLFNDEKHISYHYYNDHNLSVALEAANLDPDLEEIDSDYESHVFSIKRSEFDQRSSPLPEHLKYIIKGDMKKQFLKGHCDDYSEHLQRTINQRKPGHGFIPNEVFDKWAERIIEYPPVSVDYLYEKVESGVIIIPINVVYASYCRELAELSKTAKKSLPKGYVCNPGLKRVYNFPLKQLLTQFFITITPSREGSDKFINTNDQNVKPLSVSDLGNDTYKNIVKGIQEVYRGNIRYAQKGY